jgi:hypothetical protein
MGIVVKDQGERSQLQERLAAELREKLARSGSGEGSKVPESLQQAPDMINDSAYIKDFQKKPKGENSRVVTIVVACVIILAVSGLILVLA